MPEKLLTQSTEVFVSTTATSLAASRALKAGKRHQRFRHHALRVDQMRVVPIVGVFAANSS
jgi:hypothetical protein